MRVHLAPLLAVLDPDLTRHRRADCNSPSRRRVSTASPGSARGRQGRRDSEQEESAFDILASERGFLAFEQWYRRVLATSAGASAQRDLGVLWPQVYCPPTALHEHAFLELLRWFADCSDSEAFDLFDLLDNTLMGALALPQVYRSVCLVAALGSRQLTKFLFFHSTWLFNTMSCGCLGAPKDRLSWPRLLTLLRLLGAPCHLISRVSLEHGVESLLNYDQFLDVTFAVLWQLDRGAEFGESTVIHESERSGRVRSRACVVS